MILVASAFASTGAELFLESCARCHDRTGPGGAGERHTAVADRTPPALFGAGQIASIPDAAIRAVAGRDIPGHPEIVGSVPVTLAGEIGRFGWEGQDASVRRIVARGCVADADPGDVDALTAWVTDLPAPVLLADTPGVERGREVFHAVGCAACHVERVADVDGLYSDLLLHDIGTAPTGQRRRTPPLWGLRDSAPYLWDGRAMTIEQAMLLHDGEADRVSIAWLLLPPEDAQALAVFLRSLAAPTTGGVW